MHLAAAVVLLLAAIGLMYLDGRFRPETPRGIYYYLNPFDSRSWVVAALAGAAMALAL